jgi:zinc/manganese transport system permease protein
MGWLFEPGFFSSPEVHVALVIGGVVAVVSAVVGVFTVMRGQSFAGHALTESAATGGSGTFLIGINPLLGFVVGALAGAGAMEAVGVRHRRGRDLATGIVLGASIGLASLFLYLTTSTTATSGATQQILFGSIFAIEPSTVPLVATFGVLAVGIIAFAYRPLLLTSVSTDIAAARGVPVRRVGMAYMLALALAVGLSSLAIGAILSTALLIGPAATALRLTKRMGWAMLSATGLGVGATWLGVLLAYDSAEWGSGHDTLPVSFFIVAIVFVAYLLSGLAARQAGGGRERRIEGPGAEEPVDLGERAPLPTSEEEQCSRVS